MSIKKGATIISKDNVGHTSAWALPPVDVPQGASAAEFVKTTFNTSGSKIELLALRETAQREGFKEGYDEGAQAAQGEITTLKANLEKTLSILSQPVEKVETLVEQELLALSLAIARQVLRREVSIDPQHIIGLIRDAVKQLPSTAEAITVLLNPDDAAIVRKTLHEHQTQHKWHIVDDPAIEQSDCKIRAGTAFIDAGIDALVARLATEYLGGQRATDTHIEETTDAPRQR